MDDKEKTTNQFDENERHREMTEERKMKRDRILKGIAIGAGVAIGVGAGVVGCNLIMDIVRDYTQPMTPMILGGAMGQWEEVPMQPEDMVVKFSKVGMRIS